MGGNPTEKIKIQANDKEKEGYRHEKHALVSFFDDLFPQKRPAATTETGNLQKIFIQLVNIGKIFFAIFSCILCKITV